MSWGISEKIPQPHWFPTRKAESYLRFNDEYLSNLQFADDIVLFSNNGDKLQQMTEDLNRESLRVRLKINM